MPSPGDCEATRPGEEPELDRLRREVAIAHKERAAIWDALGDVSGRYGGETTTTLPDAVRALVLAYNGLLRADLGQR